MPTSQKSQLSPADALEFIEYGASDPDYFFKYALGIHAEDYQIKIAESVRDNRITSVKSSHEIGKGLPLDTPIATPTGWTTMGELRLGDKVFGEHGQITAVRAVHEPRDIPCYRVKFDNGTSMVCDKDHLWNTLDFKSRGRLKLRNYAVGKRVMDWRKYWSETATTSVAELQDKVTHGRQRSLLIPVAAALQLPEQEYELDPYTFGVWLGDGTSIRTEITDPRNEMRPFVEAQGHITRDYRNGYSYNFWPHGDGVALLRRLEVYGVKHIPDNYARGSVTQRLELLQGLMDSDGHCTKRGVVELTLTNQQLAEDAAALVASLGWKVRVKDEAANLYGRFISRRYRISFRSDICPFKLHRKVDAWHPPEIQASAATGHVITGIEPVESITTRCITVNNPTGLFLAGRQMIPTHNSFIAARITVWYLLTHPESIVVTTAPTARQVENILWREINTAYSKALMPLAGKCLNTVLEFAPNWYGVGYSTTEPDKFQGMHSDSGDLLVITDEAAGIPEQIFEGVRAVMTSSKCRLLMIGNPTSSSGTFYNSHTPDSTANKMTVSMFDTPNFRANNITNEAELIEAIESGRELLEPAPYLASPIWGYECVMEWGMDSPMYQARCMGIFPEQGDETLIPLAWILASMTPERHSIIPKGVPRYGVDVARFGSDRTVIQPRFGDVVEDPVEYSMKSTMETAGIVMNLLTNHPTASAFIDVIGVGGGVVDRLHELQREKLQQGTWQWTKITAVNVAEKAEEPTVREKEAEKRYHTPKMGFRNKRAQLYWRLRKKFEDGDIALPDSKMGRKLASELSQIQYKFESDGTIYIEEKKDIKKRLLSSPDLADALMLSYAGSTATAAHHVMAEDEPEDYDEPLPGAGLMDMTF
jgi:phage terminase large subunit